MSALRYARHCPIHSLGNRPACPQLPTCMPSVCSGGEDRVYPSLDAFLADLVKAASEASNTAWSGAMATQPQAKTGEAAAQTATVVQAASAGDDAAAPAQTSGGQAGPGASVQQALAQAAAQVEQQAPALVVAMAGQQDTAPAAAQAVVEQASALAAAAQAEQKAAALAAAQAVQQALTKPSFTIQGVFA